MASIREGGQVHDGVAENLCLPWRQNHAGRKYSQMGGQVANGWGDPLAGLGSFRVPWGR